MCQELGQISRNCHWIVLSFFVLSFLSKRLTKPPKVRNEYRPLINVEQQYMRLKKLHPEFFFDSPHATAVKFAEMLRSYSAFTSTQNCKKNLSNYLHSVFVVGLTSVRSWRLSSASVSRCTSNIVVVVTKQ